MDAIDALAGLGNLLDYGAVEQIIQSNRQYAVDQYVEVEGNSEPIRLTLQDSAHLKGFPTVKLKGYSIYYSDHPDFRGAMYPPETAQANLTLLPDKECVNRDKVVSRYGQPDSVRRYENGEASFSWNIVHDSRRLLVLSLDRVSDTPTNDDVMPPWKISGDPSGFHLAVPRKSECEQIGIELRELRPHYHFRDVPALGKITLIDRVTLHPPTLRTLTRSELTLTYKGAYPEHGAMLATGGFVTYFGSDWVVADLDRRELRCVHQSDGRMGGHLFKDETTASLSPDQFGQLAALVEDARTGKDLARRKTQLIADEPVNSVLLFRGDQVQQADDDHAFFALPRLADLLGKMKRTSCTGKPVRTPIVEKPAG